MNPGQGLDESIAAIFRRQEELAATPASDEQLARIWPPWNKLPGDILPEAKAKLLCFDEDSKHCIENRGVSFQSLREDFDYLPQDCNEYRQALNRACDWGNLLKFIQTTNDLHKALVEKQWAFAEADNQASGRIVIFRAARELELTHPGLIETKEPTLAQISLLESRRAAYSQAREEALAALSKLIFKVPGIRTGKTLPFADRAQGVPHPQDDVPRHLFLARLDALGICSEGRLREFIREELPTLSRAKRQAFYAMSLKPRHGKEPYAALQVWLLENRPVFEHEEFPWKWDDVQSAAQARGINCPKNGIKQWASNNELGLRIKRGPATVDDRLVVSLSSLLSPAPVFGDILKEASR